jgi:hypothetical protein
MTIRGIDWTKWQLTPWRAQVTPRVLPILIKMARRGENLTYTDLAAALHKHYGLTPKARKTLYGHPVGVVGFALQDLGRKWRERIPPINVLVVTKSTGLPGIGADEIVRYFFRGKSRRDFSSRDRKAMMEEATQAVWNYGNRWVAVAEALCVDLLKVRGGRRDEEESLDLPPTPNAYGPESKEHKALKQWVSLHPEIFRDIGRFGNGENEYLLRSGDRPDVHFDNGSQRLAVEVKTGFAPYEELVRGVFQVIKYRSVLRAEQRALGLVPNGVAVLVSTKRPDVRLVRLMKRLQVVHVNAPATAES